MYFISKATANLLCEDPSLKIEPMASASGISSDSSGAPSASVAPVTHTTTIITSPDRLAQLHRIRGVATPISMLPKRKPGRPPKVFTL